MGLIDAKARPDRIRRAYDLYSAFYGRLIAPLERRSRMEGLERASIGPQEKVLEVAVGPGNTFAEIMKRVDRENTVCGVDLSGRMLEKASDLARGKGFASFRLERADARSLPFADGSFDVLYNSYMLDLIPLADIPGVLSEFKRVLKPGGRLALVNMSKKEAGTPTFYERLYRALPARLVPYLLGGCRPMLAAPLVEEAGFIAVSREYLPGAARSEVVLAEKPRA